MSAQLLVQTLKKFDEALAGLRTVLKSSTDQLFVYYICPLTNLREIATVGILPNATAPESRTDLSGQSVQARRQIDILLTGGRQVNAHQCINLFWNPINWTMRAFQRNGLLCEASSKIPDDAIICVLEINLEKLILDERCEWTIAPQNFAGTGFANFSKEYFTGEVTWQDGTPRCDWRSIFSIALHTDRILNRKRSAELIVHLGDNMEGTGSIALPFGMIERIIIPADEVRTLTQDQTEFLSSTGKTITRLSSVNGIPVYFPKDQLLKAESKFLDSLVKRRRKDPNVLIKINAALNALELFETEHPELCPSRDRFLRPELADGYHGSMHAARVMFWSAFLVQHLEEAIKQELLPVVLAAASLHDTYREGNNEEETHGQLAVEAHQTSIEKLLQKRHLLASCLNAIQFHCIPDNCCPNSDFTLQIIKDADALDRGRFAPPNKPGGCEAKFFRTDVLTLDETYNNIAWMAYWAAQITRYSPVGSSPCSDFSRSLCDAVNSLSAKRT